MLVFNDIVSFTIAISVLIIGEYNSIYMDNRTAIHLDNHLPVISAQFEAYEEEIPEPAEPVKKATKPKEQKEQKSVSSEEETNSTVNAPSVFSFGDDVKSSYVRGVVGYYNKIPQKIRSSFESDGSNLIITSENLGALVFGNAGMHVLAATDEHGGNVTIYIAYRKNNENSVLHEMGHYVDAKRGSVCGSEEFQDIWHSETDSLISITHDKYNTYSAHEFFAEAFYVYINNGGALQEHCPRVYAYIDNVVAEF